MDILYNTNFNYAPAILESLSYQWTEDHPIIRTNGFPYLLYLKTHSGIGIIQVGDETIFLPKNQSIIIEPHIPYQYASHSNKPWQTDFFSVSGELVPIISNILEYQNYLYIKDDQNFNAQQIIKKWYETLQTNHEMDNYFQLSVDILDFFVHLKTNLSTPKISNHYAYKTYVQPTLTFIKIHYQENIKVSDLANMVNVTPQYLTKLYKDYFSLSCQQYLTKHRIKIAKNLLIQYPDLSITDVAFDCGFKTSSHFIEKFRFYNKTTPKRFRDTHYNHQLKIDY